MVEFSGVCIFPIECNFGIMSLFRDFVSNQNRVEFHAKNPSKNENLSSARRKGTYFHLELPGMRFRGM